MSKKDRSSSFVLCGHANEVQVPCQCPASCACRWEGACPKARRGKPADLRGARQAFEAYLSEPVCIGGEMTTRAAFIREMRAAGHPQRLIDHFLIGFDAGERRREALR